MATWDLLLILLYMGVIFATWVTGLEDARMLTICLIDQTSLTLMAAIGAIINGVWNSAVTLVGVEWFLGKRAERITRERSRSLRSHGTRGNKEERRGIVNHGSQSSS